MMTRPFKFALAYILINLTITANASPRPLNDSAIHKHNIARFIKTWGLIKYRSTESATGKFNADSVFLNLLPQVQNSTAHELNRLILKMVEDYCKASASNHNNPAVATSGKLRLTINKNYSWISDPYFTTIVRKKLRNLANNYILSSKHHFMNDVAYQTELPGESAYPDYQFKDKTMNYLCLAKAWNAVNYIFPYKYQVDRNWDSVLIDLIPVFGRIDSKMLYEKAILTLETATCDTHASGFLNQMDTKKSIFNLIWYPPFAYTVIKQEIVIKEFLNDSLAASSNLHENDRIIAINGIPIAKWLNERSKLLPASNHSIKARLLSTNDNGSTYAFGNLKSGVLDVRLIRGKKFIHGKITMLSRYHAPSVQLIQNYFRTKQAVKRSLKSYEDLGNGIGLIRAGHFYDADLPQTSEDSLNFETKLRNKDALIFDMRQYPQSPGLFFTYIPRALGRAGFKFARYFGADIHDPGAFVYNNNVDGYLSPNLKVSASVYQGKIVILVNEYTQSMGEWYTMMLSQLNGHTTVIGSQTAGADGDEKALNLPGGYRFMFTGNGVFYPDGRKTQRVGIRPDIYFNQEPGHFSHQSDPLMQKAIDLIQQKKLNDRK